MTCEPKNPLAMLLLILKLSLLVTMQQPEEATTGLVLDLRTKEATDSISGTKGTPNSSSECLNLDSTLYFIRHLPSHMGIDFTY
jgi:hypothetical protein